MKCISARFVSSFVGTKITPIRLPVSRMKSMRFWLVLQTTFPYLLVAFLCILKWVGVSIDLRSRKSFGKVTILCCLSRCSMHSVVVLILIWEISSCCRDLRDQGGHIVGGCRRCSLDWFVLGLSSDDRSSPPLLCLSRWEIARRAWGASRWSRVHLRNFAF